MSTATVEPSVRTFTPCEKYQARRRPKMNQPAQPVEVNYVRPHNGAHLVRWEGQSYAAQLISKEGETPLFQFFEDAVLLAADELVVSGSRYGASVYYSNKPESHIVTHIRCNGGSNHLVRMGPTEYIAVLVQDDGPKGFHFEFSEKEDKVMP